MTVVTRNATSLAAHQARILTDAKAEATRMINDAAGTLRERYITAIPGQDMIYLAKKDEAISYVALAPATLADYPLLAAEVGITAPTAYELSQLWLNMGAAWLAAAADIEAARLGAIAQVQIATSVAAAMAIAEATRTALLSS